MPKTTKQGKPKKEELPDTLKRSPEKAQRTYAKAHDSAVDTYGEGERAHRTAYSALKRKDRRVVKDVDPRPWRLRVDGVLLLLPSVAGAA